MVSLPKNLNELVHRAEYAKLKKFVGTPISR